MAARHGWIVSVSAVEVGACGAVDREYAGRKRHSVQRGQLPLRISAAAGATGGIGRPARVDHCMPGSARDPTRHAYSTVARDPWWFFHLVRQDCRCRIVLVR
jgi:hypothetical protein